VELKVAIRYILDSDRVECQKDTHKYNSKVAALLVFLRAADFIINFFLKRFFSLNSHYPNNFKVAAFIALDTLAVQHSKVGKAQAAAHYGFGGGWQWGAIDCNDCEGNNGVKQRPSYWQRRQSV